MEEGKIKLPGDDIPSSPFQRFLIGFGVTFIFVIVGLLFDAKKGEFWDDCAHAFVPVLIAAVFLGSLSAAGKWAARFVFCMLEALW
jgi:hypothetical protein